MDILPDSDNEEGKADFHPLEADKIIGGNEINSIPKHAYEQALDYYQQIQYKIFNE